MVFCPGSVQAWRTSGFGLGTQDNPGLHSLLQRVNVCVFRQFSLNLNIVDVIRDHLDRKKIRMKDGEIFWDGGLLWDTSRVEDSLNQTEVAFNTDLRNLSSDGAVGVCFNTVHICVVRIKDTHTHGCHPCKYNKPAGCRLLRDTVHFITKNTDAMNFWADILVTMCRYLLVSSNSGLATSVFFFGFFYIFVCLNLFSFKYIVTKDKDFKTIGIFVFIMRIFFLLGGIKKT